MSGQPETMQEYIARQIHEPCKKRERELEASLASLRASHQEVIRVVREWQELREARYADHSDTPGAEFDRIKAEYEAAEAALAALDLGRNG